MTADFGLYIHVPFCTKRCPYCAFVLIEADGSDRRFDDAVAAHMEAESARRGRVPFSTFYFGGGTPSLLEPDRVARLLDAGRKRFTETGPLEVTLEANPENCDPARLRGFREAGVNRISLGVQSLRDDELKFLGRGHDAARARASFTAAREAGFGNICVDVIFGLPGQALEHFEPTLDEVIRWNPEHVSMYGLTVEKGTALERMIEEGLANPRDTHQKGVFETVMDRLAAAGYGQYEISNFARPGFESRHNSGYWTGRPYLGFGPGAHSYVPNRRWANVSNVNLYLQGDRLPMMVEELTVEQRMLERVFLGLRRMEGLDVEAFEREFDVNFLIRYESALSAVDGLVIREKGRLRLNRRGIMLADTVIGAFA